MKTKNTLLLVLATTLFVTAFKGTVSIISELGMDQDYAQGSIINNFIGRFSNGAIEPGFESNNPNSVSRQLESFKIPWAPKLKSIITGNKEAAAQELCEYVKNYINSEKFIKDYTNLREDALPLDENIATLRKNCLVYEKNIKNYPNDKNYVAEQQKLLADDQKKIENTLEAAKRPFPNKDLWEKTYPADPAIIVKKRLEEYLQLVATVDFNAQLSGADKMQKFVNPVYEKKSLKWKAIYRSGKEVNDVVTAFVKDWLKSEIISSSKTSMAIADDSKLQAPQQAQGVANTKESTSISKNSTPSQSKDSTTQETKAKKSLLGKLKTKVIKVIKE